jgi:prevent-host-death family protein
MELSIAQARKDFSRCIKRAMSGEEIVIEKHGRPVAKITGIRGPAGRAIRFNCGEGTVRIKGDLTAPAIPPEDWETL